MKHAKHASKSLNMSSRRSTKFYRRNESEVMKRLGFKPTINSGAGWIEKEDGENDIAICQLKSTDAQSISVRLVDLHILEEHAAISHKVPVFAIQFLNTGEIWLMMKPEDCQIRKDKTFINFDEINKKSVDNEPEKLYNTIEAENRAEARKEFYRRAQEEKEKKQKEVKQRRKVYNKEWRRKNLNKEE